MRKLPFRHGNNIGKLPLRDWGGPDKGAGHHYYPKQQKIPEEIMVGLVVLFLIFFGYLMTKNPETFVSGLGLYFLAGLCIIVILAKWGALPGIMLFIGKLFASALKIFSIMLKVFASLISKRSPFLFIGIGLIIILILFFIGSSLFVTPQASLLQNKNNVVSSLDRNTINSLPEQNNEPTAKIESDSNKTVPILDPVAPQISFAEMLKICQVGEYTFNSRETISTFEYKTFFSINVSTPNVTRAVVKGNIQNQGCVVEYYTTEVSTGTINPDTGEKLIQKTFNQDLMCTRAEGKIDFECAQLLK
ncbi:MAG: hypothetical protein WCW13_04615 [archaeon]|jgi:hypothetical protein